jgi:hypothetical protein
MNIFSKWFEKPPQKIGFEDMKYVIDNYLQYLIINTLPTNEQSCLIKNTISYDIEESTLNEKITQYKMSSCYIIIYGRNSTDITVDKKYKQLCSLGFTNIYIYSGGLFEWLLLQDVYGTNDFPTTTKELDILKYRSPKLLNIPRITY